MSLAAAEPSAQPAAQALTPAQEAFVRAELIRRLFEGSAQSRYFSFVLWPVIAAIYWRQIDLLELAPPFAVHIVVTIGFDILRLFREGAECFKEHRARSGCNACDHCGEELFLVADLVVYGLPGNSRLGSDGVDAGAGKPLATENRGSCFNDRGTLGPLPAQQHDATASF